MPSSLVPALRGGTWLVPVAVAGSTFALSLAFPLASPLLVALILGAVVANTRWSEHSALGGHEDRTRLLLRLGIVMLGARLSVAAIAEIGMVGMVVVVSTVVTTYVTTTVVGRRLGLEHSLVALVAAGFSICGAAAIAAVQDGVRASRRDVGLAVGLVTVHGTVMILFIPWAAGRLGLAPQDAAVWAGASIHEVAQVVAAASLIGGVATSLAITVKLGRVLLLAPVHVITTRRSGASAPDDADGQSPPALPWYVVGFCAVVGMRSLGLIPTPVVDVLSVSATLVLAVAMFGLGLGIRLRELWPVPPRLLLLSAVSTVTAAGSSLLLVLLLG